MLLPSHSKERQRIDRRQRFIDMYRNLLWFGHASTYSKSKSNLRFFYFLCEILYLPFFIRGCTAPSAQWSRRPWHTHTHRQTIKTERSKIFLNDIFYFMTQIIGGPIFLNLYSRSRSLQFEWARVRIREKLETEKTKNNLEVCPLLAAGAIQT